MILHWQVMFLKKGSPKYMAPEILNSKASAAPSMDIWALGVILYRIIFGVYPFEGNNCREIFDKIKKVDYKFPKDF